MKKHRKSSLFIFLGPMLVFFAGMYIYPIVKTLLMSFFYIQGITDSKDEWSFVGIQNYGRLFNLALFRQSMINVGKIWLYGGAIVLGLSLLFAVILTSGIRFKRFFRAVIYLPNIVSAVALATMWLQYVYNPQFGMLKKFFTALHLDALASIPWTDGDHKFMAMLIAYCFGMIGYHMLIWISGIERIGPELVESARINGANQVQIFWYITLPLLKGILKTNVVMWSISSAGFFTWSQLFANDGAEASIITPMVYMYTTLFGTGGTVDDRQAGLAAAVGVVLSLCIVVIFAICNRMIRDDDLEF